MKKTLINAEAIVRRQIEWTRLWHEAPTRPKVGEPWPAIECNHRMNFDLWHAEDAARRDDLGSASVRDAKRAIDRCNQLRNDAIEQLDAWLLSRLPAGRPDAPLHSETPGMMVDRLSILALKIFHMRVESARPSATAEHRGKCFSKCARLVEQQADLQRCLQLLVAELQSGARQYKLYRQFKMYNDDSLNPQLYQKTAGA
jgi:hypothetical protein